MSDDNPPQHTKPSTFFFSAQIQAHFIPSGTRLAQEYLDIRLLQDANMFAQLGMGHDPRTLAPRATRGRVYRESQLDERSLASSLSREREATRERERKKENETHEKR